MIESWAEITCKFPSKDQQKWQTLIEGLSNNQHGAYLEEYAEAFGEKAEEMVGYVLDEWEDERGEIDTRPSKISKGKGLICIGGYYAVEPSIQPMMDFLKACGATEVTLADAYGDTWAE